MSRVPVRRRAAFTPVDYGTLVPVYCGWWDCPARQAELGVKMGRDGPIWDGPVYARSTGRQAMVPMPGPYWSGYVCRRCGAPWPDDDTVTELVMRARREKWPKVVFGQPPPPRRAEHSSRDW